MPCRLWIDAFGFDDNFGFADPSDLGSCRVHLHPLVGEAVAIDREVPVLLGWRESRGRDLPSHEHTWHGGELRPKPTLEVLIGPQLAGDGVASIGVASEKAKLRCLLPNPGPNLLGWVGTCRDMGSGLRR